MARAKKIKAEAAAFRVAQTKDETVELIAEIGRKQRQRERLRADMNDEMAAVKEKYEAQALPLADEIKRMSAGVQAWCEANRDAITNGGKVKFAMLASGKINWRMRPPKVLIRGKEAVIAALKALGLGRFLRTTEDINKEAMLAEPALAQTVGGVTISQGEDFVITPFETELEEVA
jgi:phage host-nuclease inhibitor protein Gam